MSKKKQDETLELVEAVEKAEAEGGEEDLIILSSGVKLRAKEVNMVVVMKVMAQYDAPPIPELLHPVHGRYKNPEDPDYIQQRTNFQVKYSAAILDAMILMGTELVSIPKGLMKPDSEEFTQEAKLLGFTDGLDNSRYRYLIWVYTVAASGSQDIEKISLAIGRLSGTSEDDVEAAENFPESN